MLDTTVVNSRGEVLDGITLGFAGEVPGCVLAVIMLELGISVELPDFAIEGPLEVVFPDSEKLELAEVKNVLDVNDALELALLKEEIDAALVELVESVAKVEDALNVNVPEVDGVLKLVIPEVVPVKCVFEVKNPLELALLEPNEPLEVAMMELDSEVELGLPGVVVEYCVPGVDSFAELADIEAAVFEIEVTPDFESIL